MTVVHETTEFTQIFESAVSLDASTFTGRVAGRDIQAGSLPELRSLLTAAVYSLLHSRNPRLDEMSPVAVQDLADELVALIPRPTVAHSAVGLGPVSVEGFGFGGQSCEVVEVQGVRVLFPEQHVIRSSSGRVTAVRIPSWRKRTTPGYLLAMGGKGVVSAQSMVRFYVACADAASAVAVWEHLLQRLDDSGIAYQVKTLSAAAAYPRSDALVVYVSSDRAGQVEHMLCRVINCCAVKLSPQSVFTEPVAYGVGRATEPTDRRPGYAGLSFGQHRSRVAVDALIRAATTGSSFTQAWQHEAHLAQINPAVPGRNI